MRFSSSAQTNPWLNSPTHSSLVNIGTHSLWASISGPLRAANSPLLIFITGAGGASAIHVKLQQRLTPYIRCVFYDRAGYDRSTLPPLDAEKGDKIVADDTARDLTALLAATGLEPPYLLVAHSFGGIIARTFLAHHNDNPATVAGMLLFDTATELMLSPLYPRMPPLELEAVARNVDYAALTHLKRDSGFSDTEWEYAIEASERCRHAQTFEDTHASAHLLALRRQLDFCAFGTRPLTVVRCNIAADYQFLFDEGVKSGDGSERERKVAKEFVERCWCFLGQLQRAQWGLSQDVVDTHFVEWGHDLPIRRPGIVVDMVTELVGRIERKGGRGKCVEKAGKEREEECEDVVVKTAGEEDGNTKASSLPIPAVMFLG